MRRLQPLSPQVLITPGFPLKRNETVWLRTIYVHVIPMSEQYKRIVIAVTGFNRLIDTSTGQGKTSGRFFFQMNPGLRCPIVMIRSGSTDVGVNVTLTVVSQRDRFGGGGSVMVRAGIGYGYRTQLVFIDGNLNAQKY